MKPRTYCYHITDSVRRSALQCGTVKAYTMEEAAEIAARRAGLDKTIIEGVFGQEIKWTKDGRRRNVYVLHDPKA